MVNVEVYLTGYRISEETMRKFLDRVDAEGSSTLNVGGTIP